MANLIVAGIILAILSLSITKIVIEKRKGVHCVGCPSSGGKPMKKGECGCNEPTQIKM